VQGRAAHSNADEPGHQIGQPVAPIETVRELGEIAPRIARLAGMMGSVDRALDADQRGVPTPSRRTCRRGIA